MKTLRDYAGGAGQWGEGGMIAEIERRTNTTIDSAVEFGAGDSAQLINTLDLARRGVECLWLEADVTKMPYLQAIADELPATALRNYTVTDIDELFEDWSPSELISIDVDGADFALFANMKARPDFVIVEHNPTVPPHIYWVGSGARAGASAYALVDLAESKGYRLVGATVANLIFVLQEHSQHFWDLETDLEAIFDRSQLNYVISDYDGNFATTGPWPFGMASTWTWNLEVEER